jgi:16S rRNA (guanine(966)-N(2))-methyltransferase RsmD
LREALFEVLGARIEGAHFLDLCAGSGAVGIEALSRGAAHATFVDRSRKMSSFIEMNLELCGTPVEHFEIVTDDAIHFLRLKTKGEHRVWDVVFFDPPYMADYAPVLKIFGQAALLKQPHSLLIVEHYYLNELPERVGQVRCQHFLRQGDSCLSFYNADRIRL